MIKPVNTAEINCCNACTSKGAINQITRLDVRGQKGVEGLGTLSYAVATDIQNSQDKPSLGAYARHNVCR